jgi:hypothetical protein
MSSHLKDLLSMGREERYLEYKRFATWVDLRRQIAWCDGYPPLNLHQTLKTRPK